MAEYFGGVSGVPWDPAEEYRRQMTDIIGQRNFERTAPLNEVLASINQNTPTAANAKIIGRIVQERLPETLLAQSGIDPTYAWPSGTAIRPGMPKVVNAWADELAAMGERLPRTLRGISWIEPTDRYSWLGHANPTEPSHLYVGQRWAQMQNPQEFQWGLGISPQRGVRGLTKTSLETMRSGFHPGAYLTPDMPPEAVFQRGPVAMTPSHEMIHGLDFNMQDFLRRGLLSPADQKAAVGVYDSLVDQLAVASLNRKDWPSEYANEHAREVINNLISSPGPGLKRWYHDPITRADIELPDAALGKLETLASRARQNLPITSQHFEGLPTGLKSEIATEAFAEAGSLHYGQLNPTGEFIRNEVLSKGVRTPLTSPYVPKETRNAIVLGDKIAEAEQSLGKFGFEGSATVGALGRVAGPALAMMAAPVLINKFVKDKATKKKLNWITQGAGLGGMFGPEGALAGAGIGGLLSQVIG